MRLIRPARHRVLVAASGVGCVLAILVLTLGTDDKVATGGLGDDAVAAAGRVVDSVTGKPVAARIELLRVGPAGGSDVVASARTGRDGDFRADLPEPTLARITAAGHLSRVVALDPRLPITIGLTPDRKDSVSLRFGGDVMLGRRFYQPSRDHAAWLSREPSASELAAPLAEIAPLLGDADVSVVNLETALVRWPWIDGDRPRWAHAEKELVVTSPLGLARAIADSGVDVVDLANNHVYDGLDRGLARTLDTVEQAGLVHFGAGLTIADAWRPAYLEKSGQTIGFVGCTTVDGEAHLIGYVATATHGGAARCDPDLLRTALREAAAKADVVVFMVHGGTEYVRGQTDEVRYFSRLAARSGATLVVDGHPHVVAGVREYAGVPVVESAGNLLFDQVLWDTFLSYLPRVDLTAGHVARMTVDPFVLDDYRPVPTVGSLADDAARVATGTLPGPLALAAGGAATPGGRDGATAAATMKVVDGRIQPVPEGAGLTGDPAARPGRDLLWGSGSMEDLDTATDTGPAGLWTLGRFAEVSREAACAGDQGLMLRRSPVSTRDVVAAPSHRQSVEPGSWMTLVADVRQASPGASLELRWYRGPAGASVDVVRLPIPRHTLRDGCGQVRLDVRVPAGVRAAQPWLRLHPPHDVNLAAELRIDNVRFIDWSRPGLGGRSFDVVEASRDGEIALTRDPALR